MKRPMKHQTRTLLLNIATGVALAMAAAAVLTPTMTMASRLAPLGPEISSIRVI
jgi:hypothetical protein